MSVQFGRWNTDGKPVEPEYLEKVKPVIAPYGFDDSGSYSNTSISILYRAFHTTKESRRETQPLITDSGAAITWDGRLDNRAELIRRLRNVLTIDPTDLSIVAAAYGEWGTDCFAKLIGDWALSIWDTNSRSLLLAKDPIGTRPLHFSIEKDQVTWSTILDPLVLFAGKTFALNEKYVAGWFSFCPATHLTPYVGIHSVPPSSFVAIRAEKHTTSRYWEFDSGKRIRYSTDAEYEEHFRAVFAQAVRRRLRSDSPILAELSGGIDSSSIVCMADTILARGIAETHRLDTVSYYDDSEPNWNERPYFSKVEEKLGRTGCHIDVGAQKHSKFELVTQNFAATPGSHLRLSEFREELAACMKSQGNRVTLSGIGGDEVMGGIPAASPELQDLLVTGRFRDLAHQLKVWALDKRRPWFHLIADAALEFLPSGFVATKATRPAMWLNPKFVGRNRTALLDHGSRVKLFGPLPSFQHNISTLEVLRRQIACLGVPSAPLCEKRYPYLDRDLLEFIYAIPREQLVRPGQRRSLMRRALGGIVPDEILNRKRKAYVVRGLLRVLLEDWSNLQQLFREPLSEQLGFIQALKFSAAVEGAVLGRQENILRLERIFDLELWLRSLSGRASMTHNPVLKERLQSQPVAEPHESSGGPELIDRRNRVPMRPKVDNPNAKGGDTNDLPETRSVRSWVRSSGDSERLSEG